jgi:hypothetical protein
MVGYVVLPLLGIAALGSYLSLSSLGTQIEQRMEEEAALIARAIRLQWDTPLKKVVQTVSNPH